MRQGRRVRETGWCRDRRIRSLHHGTLLGITDVGERFSNGWRAAPPTGAGAAPSGSWQRADRRRRGRTAGRRPDGPARPPGPGGPGDRLPARRGGDPRGARPRGERGPGRRCRQCGAPGARAQGATAGARHAGVPDARRGRRRAPVLAGTRRRPPRPPRGARVAALATSPLPVEPVPTEGDRYARMLDAFGLTAREMLTCGCHVHVSVADDDEGVAVLNRIRCWLPVLTALTANSPFWQGEDTGYASFRSQAWHRWPSAGPNEVFADAAEYHRLIDARPRHRHRPRHGHGLLRRPAVGELAHGRGAHRRRRAPRRGRGDARRAGARAGRDRGPRAPRRAPRRPTSPPQVLRVAAWRAGRSGLGERARAPAQRPARRRRRTSSARCSTTSARHSPTPATSSASPGASTAILRRGTGADLQRRVHRETGDLAAVVRAAAAVTAGQPEDAARAAHGPTG